MTEMQELMIKCFERYLDRYNGKYEIDNDMSKLVRVFYISKDSYGYGLNGTIICKIDVKDYDPIPAIEEQNEKYLQKQEDIKIIMLNDYLNGVMDF